MNRRGLDANVDNRAVDLLADLNPPQRDAVTHLRGPLLILAGAGSGKTRVITRRIAYLVQNGIRPANILGVTFTNKAADEMRDRVHRLIPNPQGLTLSTFHSFCARFLRQHHAALGLSHSFTIFDADDQRALLKKVIEDLNLSPQYYKPADMQSRISRAKNHGLTPHDFAQQYRGHLEQSTAQVFERYQTALRDQQALDFDDLLLQTVRLLRDFPDIRRSAQERYRFVLIDEYQDTNSLQADIGRLIAEDHHNICVTGDPDQAIYSWRGANVNNILDFAATWPGTKVVTLSENYRSTPTILAAADALIANNRARLQKTMTTTNPDTGKIVVRQLDDEEAEAAWVAQTIADLVAQPPETTGLPDRLRHDDCAVFFRTNTQSRVLESALMRFGIPYQLVRGVEFYQRAEIKDLLAYLRLIVNPRDELSLRRAINTPPRGIGDTTVAKLSAYATRGHRPLIAVLGGTDLDAAGLSKAAAAKVRGFADLLVQLQALPRSPVASVIRQIVDRLKFKDYVKSSDALLGDDREHNIGELITVAEKFDDQQPGATLEDFLVNVALVSDADRLSTGADTQPRVPLMTLHAAKGLEFKVVFLVGMEEQIFPHSRVLSDIQANLEEERRLAYVGITRAMRRLYLSHVGYRRQGGISAANLRSRFIDELPPQLLQIDSDDDSNLDDPALHTPIERIQRRWGYGFEYDRPDTATHTGAATDDAEANDTITRKPRQNRKRGRAIPPRQPTLDTDANLDADTDSQTADLQPPPGTITVQINTLAEIPPGTPVFHSQFGVGRVVKHLGTSSVPRLDVDFNTSGRERLVLSPALWRIVE